MTEASNTTVHPKVKELHGLTFLRFVAALFVVLYHYVGNSTDIPAGVVKSLLSLGYTGVTFFFLLSGFILAYNYEHVDFRASGSVRKYLWARFARIYPLYLLSLAVGLGPYLFAIVKPEIHPTLHKLYLLDLILAPLSLQAWVPGAASAINSPSWSISAEFFFYACFPLLLRWVVAAPRLWLGISLAYWLGINVITYVLWNAWGPQGVTVVMPHPLDAVSSILLAEFIKFCPLFRLPEFIGGILAYFYWKRHSHHLKTLPLLVIAAVGFIMLISMSSSLPATLIHNGFSAVVWLPLIFLGAQTHLTLLTSRLSVFLGKLSFALYLFHVPCLHYVKAMDKHFLASSLTPVTVAETAFVLVVVLSGLAHVFIEEPMRRRLQAFSLRGLSATLNNR
jgi:peptidoglycan/LPS O-acetylase OafA/YrhL